MVMCYAPTCKHYSERQNCKFFVFPKNKKELKKWITLLRRGDRNPSKHSRVCSCHFLNGDRSNRPTIFDYNEGKRLFMESEQVFKRKRRKVTKPETEAGPSGLRAIDSDDKNAGTEVLQTEILDSEMETPRSYDLIIHSRTADFDSLPIAVEKRNLWLSVLGLDQEHQFPKKVEICSNHFDQSDYVYREDESRYLKPYAAPLPIHSVFASLDTESTGSDSTLTAMSSADEYDITEAELEDKSAEKRLKMETDILTPFHEKYLKPNAAPLPTHSAFVSLDTESIGSESIATAISSADEYAVTIIAKFDEQPAEKSPGSEHAISSADEDAITIKEEHLSLELDDIPGEERIEMEAHISRSFHEKTSEVVIACNPASSTSEDSSSSTLSASEIDDLDMEIPTHLNPKRIKKTLRYVGDLRSDDFTSPRKAIKNYRWMKSTIDEQRKKIRSLESTVVWLRKKIKTFQERFKTSKKK